MLVTDWRTKARARRSDAGEPLTPFAANLGRLRRARGITQAVLAEMTGVHERSIGLYERGTVEPTAGALCRLADYFGVSMDSLWRGGHRAGD